MEGKKNITRKAFLKKAGIATLGGASLLKSCASDENTNAPITPEDSTIYKWKMVTTWPPNFPVLGEGCNLFADWVREMSNGRLDITVYGSGELIPALEVFYAVSSGTAEIGNGASYYWAGNSPATQFFASIPFGMNAQQMMSWIEGGGGKELWRSLYEKFNLIPFASGNTGVQMGGWFNKEINSVKDLEGLKMRIPGIGGKVLEKAGGTAVLSAGSEIFTNLERGVIDATEWIGPYHDYKMGFHNITKYYYYPGWHEPGTILETLINKEKYESLPPDLQMIVEAACAKQYIWTLSEFESKNNEYLERIKKESSVEIRKFPKEVLEKLKLYAEETMQEICDGDKDSAKIYKSFKRFKKTMNQWANLTEAPFYNDLK